ncbi:MAG TPA: hypothetical protein PLK99_07715, partial [Burkholderiales bacterium]|nr:hypothetical protein [Burkholderiales bacterium]
MATVVGGSLFFFTVQWIDYKEKLLDQLRMLAAASAAATTTYFEDKSAALENLGSTLLDEGADREREQRLVDTFKASHTELNGVHVFLPDGRFVVSTSPPRSKTLVGYPEYWAGFKNCRETTRLCILPPMKGIVNPSRLEIPMIYRVRRGGNQPFSILVSIPLENQQLLWNNSGLLEGMAISLLRDDGYLQGRYPTVSRREFELPRNGILEQTLRTRSWKRSGTFSGYDAMTNQSRMGAYARLGYYPMTASVSVPSSLMWSHWLGT